MRVRSSLPLLALATVFVAGSAGADIYQYTDADGVVHFANSPPAGGGAKVVVKGSGGSPGGRPLGPIVPPHDRDPARFTRYDEWIHQAATLYQIPEALVRAVM